MNSGSSNIFISTETRWFFKGPIPGEIFKEFQNSSPFAEKLKLEQRTDHYLIFPKSKFVGVKIREGKLEIKAFAGGAKIDFPAKMNGVAENWEKWSYSSEEKEFAEKIHSSGKSQWLPLTKKRMLRFWDDEGKEHSPGEHLEKGCEVEVGEVSTTDNTYWTVALEAFGKGDTGKTLQTVLSHVFGPTDPAALVNLSEVLSGGRSMSFPGLLQMAE